MGDIKSAREIAMEKIQQMGEPTEEERLKWKYVPQGEQIAARYLKDDANLVSELGQFQGNVKKYIAGGAAEVLIRNIGLPKNEAAKKAAKKSMDGLKTLKSDKGAVENVFSQIRFLFNHYAEQGEKQRKAAHEQLKADFAAKLQQAIQQQGQAASGARMNVETHPQFQQEWRKLQADLDSQYLIHLNEFKKQLSAIP